MKAVRIERFGGPEVLTPCEIEEPVVPAGSDAQVLEIAAAGVNYADTHAIEGGYGLTPTLPYVPGIEAVGRLADGTRVAAILSHGAYAERAVVWPAATFPVPKPISDAEALALVLQGTTAWHVLATCARVRPGESVVVHAAAGGVGTLAVQLARLLGAGRVVAVASSSEKRELALDLGADAAIDSREPDLKGAIEAANEDRKADVILEMTGGEVFAQSFAALAPFGRLVTYGIAGRIAADAIEPRRVMGRSRGVLGYMLEHALARPPMMSAALTALQEHLMAGRLRVIEGGRYPLSQAREAHIDLRDRGTTGKLVLDAGA